MKETEHPGFPPKYWDMLAKAAQEMDRAEACSECLMKWRDHGPAHYRAFRNIEHCTECATRTALPVEKAVLDWQYEHDPLKTAVKKLVDAYRAIAAPDAARSERIQEDIDAMRAFWQAASELDSIIPKEKKEA